jgi:hypothetical protein
MVNVNHVLMDTTYQEQLVRSVMLFVLPAQLASPLNVQDALKATFWMSPPT